MSIRASNRMQLSLPNDHGVRLTSETLHSEEEMAHRAHDDPASFSASGYMHLSQNDKFTFRSTPSLSRSANRGNMLITVDS